MKRLAVILNSKAAVVALFCVLLGAVSLIIPIEANDFNDVYYPAGNSVLRTGTFDYSYWDSIDQSASGAGDDVEGYVNIPLITYLFAPFAIFDIQTAGALFLVFELAAYIIAFVIALKFLAKTRLDRWVLFFLFLFSRHIYTSIQFGQLTILCFLLLALAFVAYQKRRLFSTGLLLTSAFLIKIPLGLLFVYFLYKRESKVVISSIVSYIAIMLASISIFGVQLHVDYFNEVVVKNAGSTLLAYNNSSLHAFAMRFLQPGGLFDWSAVRVPPVVNLLILLAIASLLVYLGKVMMRARLPEELAKRFELSIVVSASLLVLPLVWDHYFLFLVLPFYVSYEAIVQSSKKVKLPDIIFWCAAFVLVNLPVLSLIRLLSDTGWPQTVVAALPSAPLLGCGLLMLLLLKQYRGLKTRERLNYHPVDAQRPALTPAKP